MVSTRWILHDPAHAAGGYGIFEFPVGIALEVEACGEGELVSPRLHILEGGKTRGRCTNRREIVYAMVT